MLIFIVIIIGGLGSVGGCFVGALLVALIANYIGFLAPKVALVSNIAADGRDPAVAAAGPLSGDQADDRCSMPALRRPAAQPRARPSLLVVIVSALALRAVPVSRRARR